MRRQAVDWDRCKKELEDIVPQVKHELEQGLTALYGTNITFSLEVGDYPPHILATTNVCLDPQMLQVATEIGKKYDLRVKRQEIGWVSRTERARQIGVEREDLEDGPYKRRGSKKSKNCFTLKPDYKKYVIP